jgi:serine palmitoyltransferase
LGFAENTGACAEAALKSCGEIGIATASTRMELGEAKFHDELDQLVARFVGTDAAITCAMGFATNTLNIPAILSKGCLVISDEKNHASIILGLRLSGASVRVFKHNSMSCTLEIYSKFRLSTVLVVRSSSYLVFIRAHIVNPI